MLLHDPFHPVYIWPYCSVPSHFALPAPRGCFPGSTLVPHSCSPFSHTCTYTTTSAGISAALCPPSCSQFPAEQQELAEKKDEESSRMCIHLSCYLLLEMEGKAQRARQGEFPLKGRAENTRRLEFCLQIFPGSVPEKIMSVRIDGSSAGCPSFSVLEDLLSTRPSSF